MTSYETKVVAAKAAERRNNAKRLLTWKGLEDSKKIEALKDAIIWQKAAIEHYEKLGNQKNVEKHKAHLRDLQDEMTRFNDE